MPVPNLSHIGPDVQPNCHCNVPALEGITKRDGPNHGRRFWKCSGALGAPCNYFKFVDGEGPADPSRADAQSGPPCFCGQVTMTLTVRKEGPNTGRSFYKCAKAREEQCGYFQWTDDAPPVLGPPCFCGTPSSQNTVAKEGATKGRLFYKCSRKRCDFFQWSDEEAKGKDGAQPIPTPNRSARAHASVLCFKCNGAGHMSSECPLAAGRAPAVHGGATPRVNPYSRYMPY